MLELLKSKSVLILMAIALGVGALGYAGLETAFRKKVVTHEETVANQHQAIADAHETNAGVQDAKVEDLKAPLAAAKKDAQQAKATVAQLEQALAEEKAKPGPPDLSATVSKLDALVVGLRDENGKLIVQVNVLEQMEASATSARDEWRTTALERQKEAQALRIALSASKTMQKDWAAGATWERTQEGRQGYGAFVDYDVWKNVRAGVEVYQTQLPTTRSDIGFKVKLGLKF